MAGSTTARARASTLRPPPMVDRYPTGTRTFTVASKVPTAHRHSMSSAPFRAAYSEIGRFALGGQREFLRGSQGCRVGRGLSPRHRDERLGQVRRPQPEDQGHGHERRDHDRYRPSLAVHGNSWRMAVEASSPTSEGKNSPANGTAILAS